MSGAVVSEMLIRIAADTAQLRSEMEQVKRQMGGGFDDIKNSAISLKATLAGLVAGLSLGAVAKQFVETADAMSLMDARLKQTTGDAKSFAEAQADIYKIAQANNIGLQETTALFTKLNEPVKRLGGGVKETSAIVDSFAMSLRLGGANTQEAAAATLQFAQAMGSGKLQGDEFRSLAEASPRFMKALADGMGVPIEKLKQMGTDGKLTADIVGNALMKSLGELKKEAASMPDTVGGAFQRMKNDVMVAVNELNKNSGLTLGIAGLLSNVDALIPKIKDELGGAFEAVGQWITRNRDGLAEIWKTAMDLLGDVWEVAKAFGKVLGFLVEIGVQSGFFKTALEAVRIIIAGIRDGMEIIGATFALMGAQILKVLGIFSESAAKAAKEAEAAGLAVYERFANGDTHLAKLNAELEKTNSAAKAVGAGAKEAGAGIEASGKAAAAAAPELVKLKNKNVELTKEQKEALEHYKKLIDSINDKTGAMQLEMGQQTKLTDGQKTALKIMQDIQTGTLKLTDAQKKKVAAALEELLATEKLTEQHKQELAIQKEVEEQRRKDIEALNKHAESLEDATKKQLDENVSLKYGKEALEQLEISRLKDERATMAETVARDTLLGYCNAETDAHKRTLDALNELIAAREEGVHLKAAKEAAEEWKKTADSIETALTDSLMRAFEGGKGFMDSLMGYIKNAFKTNVVKMLVQPVMGQMNGLFGGAAAGGSGGGLMDLFSGGKSIFDLFNSGFSGIGAGIGTYVTALGNMFGSSSISAFGTGMGMSSSQAAAAASIYNNAGMQGIGSSLNAGSMAGGAAGIAGGVAGGIYGGRLISGGYSAWGGGSGNSAVNTGVAVGAAIGSIVPVLGTALGALVGGLIGGAANRLFGMKPKEYGDQGIQGSFGGGAFTGQSWANWHQDGGWFRSDKNGTDYAAVTAEVQALMNQSGKAVLDSVTGLAEALKLPTDKLIGISSEMRIKLTGDAEKDQAAIAEALAKYRDTLANSLADFLTPFQKAGESLYETMERLVSLQFSREVLNQFGGIFSKIAAGGVEATQAMIDLAGGLDNLVGMAQSFVQDFYTTQEQAGMTAKNILQQLAAVGIDAGSLGSKEAYRALVESLDVTDATQREQLNALLTLGPQFAQLSGFMEENKLTLAQVAQFAPLIAVLDPLFGAQTTATQESKTAIDATTTAVDGVAAAVQTGADATVAAINGLQGSISAAIAQAAQSSAATAAAVSSRLDSLEASVRLSQSQPYA